MSNVVTVTLLANTGGFSAGMKAAQASASQFASELDKSSKKQEAFKSVGNAAGAVGIAALAGFGMAVKASADFDKAMSGVQAATGETSGNMDKLRDAALEAGQATSFSANEAAEGITNLSKAGISTADILGGGLTGALDLAAAGEIAVGDAAELAATSMTQFGLSGEDVPHIADLLAAGAGKAQGSVEDLGMALKQGGLVSAQMGLSIEETTGTLAAFAEAGLTGSDAGTSLKTMMLRLANPAGKAKELMDEYGISLYDANGNMQNTAEVAAQLQSAFKGVDAETRNAALATIFGSDAIRGANVLYKNGAAGINEWTAKVNDSGYAAETAATLTDNLSGDLERLGGSLSTALIGTGEGAQGPLRGLVQVLDDVVNGYNSLGDGAKGAVLAIAGITGAVGIGVFALSRLAQAAITTKATLTTLAPGMMSATGAIGGMSKGMMAMRAGAGIGGMALMGYAATVEDTQKKAATMGAGLIATGAMFGPWGLAAGGAAAVVMGFAAENDKADQSLKTFHETMADPTAFEKQQSALADIKAETEDFIDNPNNLSSSILGWDWLGKDQAALDKAKEATEDYDQHVMALSDTYHLARGEATGVIASQADMARGYAKLAPVLDSVGMEYQEWLDLSTSGADGAIAQHTALQAVATDTVDAWSGATSSASDTAHGYMLAGQQASGASVGFEEIAGSLQAAAEAAAVAEHNLDALTNNLMAKQSGWMDYQDAVRNAVKAFEGTKNDIPDFGANTQAAHDAKRQLFGLAQAWNDLPERMQNADGAQRQYYAGFKRMASAMGMELPQIRRMWDNISEAPDANFKVNVQGAKIDLEQLNKDFKNLDEDILVEVKENGIPATSAGINELTRKLNLTPREVEILLEARDKTNWTIQRVWRQLGLLDKATGKPKIEVDAKAAEGALKRGLRALGLWDGYKPKKPKLDADPSGAVKAGNQADDAVNKPKQRGKPNIDADPGPAKQAGNEADTAINKPKQNGKPKIDADPSPAKRAGQEADTAVNKPKQNKQIPINADPSDALAGAGAVQAAINDLPPTHTTTLTTVHKAVYQTIRGDGGRAITPSYQGGLATPSGMRRRMADGGRVIPGGLVAGPGGPREDLIPAMLSNGEFVVNAAATRNNLAELFAMNAQGFADGGPVGGGSRDENREDRKDKREEKREDRKDKREEAREKLKDRRQSARDYAQAEREFNIKSKDSAKDTMGQFRTLLAAMREHFGKDSRQVKAALRLADNLQRLAKRQDDVAKAFSKATDKLKELQQEARAYAKSVADSLRHDAFSGDLAGSLLQLRADRNDAQEVQRDLRRARGNGLSGALLKELAASGNTALIDEVSRMSRREIKEYERLYKRRQRETRDVGDQTAHALYGKEIKAQTKATNRLDRTMNKLDRKLEKLENAVERGARRGSREGNGDRDRRERANRRGRN